MDREDVLNAVLLEYVEADERGECPSRDALIHRFPEYANQFREFFTTRDRLTRIVAPLRDGIAIRPTVSGPSGKPDSTLPYPTISSSEAPLLPFDRIGDFRLLQEVGRGGMGVVYEAEQISLRRRVALKILPFAAAIDPRHLQRFRNEAQAAAQLHHSNIVPVHAVGAEAGVHFYAMQFIDGQSLSQLLSELRTDHTTRKAHPTSTLITTEHSHRRRTYFRRVADLVNQAADALEYAHQAGIVHRDIKPANLLLDTTGRLWVTDFGLALIRSDAGLTATGELVGTVRYMSPEQALGKPGLVDHRTDIYSLGVTLYELLTLTPFFDGEDRRALLRQLADDEPRPLHAIDRTIPIELETIVLKAVAKQPVERYLSAREFADDLRRFLDDRPILARRPTVVDRFAKWLRRHRTTAAMGVGMLLLLTIGFAVTTLIIAREHNQTKQALQGEQQANERERQRATEALENYLRTKRAVDLFVELSDEELLDFPPLAAFRQRLLEAAVAYYQELTDHHDDPAIHVDLGASRDRLAKIQAELSALNDINRALLLNQSVVRSELEIQPDQKARLEPILDHLQKQQSSIGSDGVSGRRRITDSASQSIRQIDSLLTTAQRRRLKQIFLQLPGPQVFSAEIFDSLGLTPAQRVEVRRALSEATQSSLRLLVNSENREDGRVKFEKIWREASVRIIDQLTPSQRQEWAAMIGSPAQGEIRMPQPGSNRQP